MERGCDRSKRSIESASSDDDDDDDDDDDRHLKERGRERKANSRADLISALSVCLSG